MKTVFITPATSGKARLRGVALASAIIALMLSLSLEALDHLLFPNRSASYPGSCWGRLRES